jgi:hypothetical protein
MQDRRKERNTKGGAGCVERESVPQTGGLGLTALLPISKVFRRKEVRV